MGMTFEQYIESLFLQRQQALVSASGGKEGAKRYYSLAIKLIQTKSSEDIDKVQDHMTFVNAVIDAASLNLSLDPNLGECYILPQWDKRDRQNKWALRIGYRGLIKAAQESDRNIVAIDTEIVYEGEKFIARKGTSPGVDHEIDMSKRGNSDKIVGCYTVVFFRDGMPKVEIMSNEELMRIKNRSKAKSGPWATDIGEMCKKTCTRRACKQLRLTGRAAAVVAWENYQDNSSGEYDQGSNHPGEHQARQMKRESRLHEMVSGVEVRK